MPKQFKILKYTSHFAIEGCFYFLEAKFCNPEFKGSPQTSLKRSTPCQQQKQQKLDQWYTIFWKPCKTEGKLLFTRRAYGLSIGNEVDVSSRMLNLTIPLAVLCCCCDIVIFRWSNTRCSSSDIIPRL